MDSSILARQDRVHLDNGMDLRLLSALEVLQARREAGELACEDRERALCSNACLLAQLGSLIYGCDGVANYAILSPTTDVEVEQDVLPVLDTLTVEEMP